MTNKNELEPVQQPTSIDFIVNGDFVKALPQILSNLEEVKTWAITATAQDRRTIVTEETIDTAKARCADINRVVKAIDEKRKSVKGEYIKPYELFDRACKEVISELNESKDALWSQVQSFEEQRKAEKEAKLKTYWEEQIGEYGRYRTWEKICDSKWLAKTKKLDVCQKEIDAIVARIKTDVAAIKALNSEFEVALLATYSWADIGQVLQYKADLEAEKAAQKAKTDEKQPLARENTENGTPEQEPVQNDTTEQLIDIEFRVVCTVTQLKALGEYMRNNGIKYGKIPR